MSVSFRTSSVNEPAKVNNNNAEFAPLLLNDSAPIATSELDDDLDDDRQIATNPYPGIDDGFFDNENKKDTPEVERIDPSNINPKVPDIEITPSTPDMGDIPPTIFTRIGGDGDDDRNTTDAIDGASPGDGIPVGLGPNKQPHFPTYDLEVGSTFGDSNIPDVNIYQHKKTLAQGMMDLALFSANANQLRYVVESNQHPYFYPSVVLISFSLIIQVSRLHIYFAFF